MSKEVSPAVAAALEAESKMASEEKNEVHKKEEISDENQIIDGEEDADVNNIYFY